MSKASILAGGPRLILNNDSKLDLHNEENKNLDDEIAELEKLRNKNKELL